MTSFTFAKPYVVGIAIGCCLKYVWSGSVAETLVGGLVAIGVIGLAHLIQEMIT